MTTEEKAARVLLEHGMKVPLMAPLLFRLFGKKEISVLMPPPLLGTLYRISEVIESSGMGTVLNGGQAISIHELHSRFIKPLATIAAIGFLNGKWSGRIFSGPLAAWLYWHMRPLHLFACARVMSLLRMDENFTNTTRLIAGMKMTDPTLGQKESGS